MASEANDKIASSITLTTSAKWTAFETSKDRRKTIRKVSNSKHIESTLISLETAYLTIMLHKNIEALKC